MRPLQGRSMVGIPPGLINLSFMPGSIDLNPGLINLDTRKDMERRENMELERSKEMESKGLTHRLHVKFEK